MIDREELLEKLVAQLELPKTAYEKARNRYEDIGDWFNRKESRFSDNEPHIFPQGSFRLGTAIYPLDRGECFDLDLACEIRRGIDPSNHSQKELRNLVKFELEDYRYARRIETPLEEKHRCLRLNYKDEPSFHMDIVPCIPQPQIIRERVVDRMVAHGVDRQLAAVLAGLAVGITDDNDDGYSVRNREWPISNPEGYARWFESRMRVSAGQGVILNRAIVDEIPTVPEKTPLQRTVQLLKRHRDSTFKKEEEKKSAPISVIITTLAGHSYRGSNTIAGALEEVINGINYFADSGSNEVLNPVNPNENFADKWKNEKYDHLRLRNNFCMWARRIREDFLVLRDMTDVSLVSKILNQSWNERFSEERLVKEFGFPTKNVRPVTFEIPQTSKPWAF